MQIDEPTVVKELEQVLLDLRVNQNEINENECILVFTKKLRNVYAVLLVESKHVFQLDVRAPRELFDKNYILKCKVKNGEKKK